MKNFHQIILAAYVIILTGLMTAFEIFAHPLISGILFLFLMAAMMNLLIYYSESLRKWSTALPWIGIASFQAFYFFQTQFGARATFSFYDSLSPLLSLPMMLILLYLGEFLSQQFNSRPLIVNLSVNNDNSEEAGNALDGALSFLILLASVVVPIAILG